MTKDDLLPSALLALAADRPGTARRILTSLVTADPRNEKGWLYLAVTLPREQAIQSLQRVLMLNPLNKPALRNLQLLRRNPQAKLDLADVLIDEEGDEAAVFGDEPPTIQRSDYEALFGNEQATLPLAFYHMSSSSKNNEMATDPDFIRRLLSEDWQAEHYLPEKEAAADSGSAPVARLEPPRLMPRPSAAPPPPRPTMAASNYGAATLVRPNLAVQPNIPRAARQVQTAPFFNSRVSLPPPKPSSSRRNVMQRPRTGLTVWGYILIAVIVLLAVAYVLSMQPPVSIP